MTHASDIAIAVLVCALLARWTALVVGALIAARNERRRTLATAPPGPREGWPLVSVIIPAKDEEVALRSTVEAVLKADYPHLEVIVVDDGSRDATGAIAAAMALDEPRLVLLTHRVNLGKAAALNHGLRRARSDLIVTVDADTRPDPSCIRRVVTQLLDADTCAVATNVKVDERRGALQILQSLEYVAELGVDQRALALAGAITVVAGATAGWQRDAVLALGGFSADTLTEDSDLTITLQRAKRAVAYRADAITRTRAPSTLDALLKQRRRWLWGNLQTAWKHRRGLREGPGPVRWVALPNWWFINLGVFLLVPAWLVYLPHGLTHHGAPTVLLLAGGALFLEVAHCALGHALDGERGVELALAPVQRFAWPLFLWLVFASVIVTMLRGRRVGWRGAPERISVHSSSSPPGE